MMIFSLFPTSFDHFYFHGFGGLILWYDLRLWPTRSFGRALTMEYMDSPRVKIYIHDRWQWFCCWSDEQMIGWMVKTNPPPGSSKDIFYELENLSEIKDRTILKLFETDGSGRGSFPLHHYNHYRHSHCHHHNCLVMVILMISKVHLVWAPLAYLPSPQRRLSPAKLLPGVAINDIAIAFICRLWLRAQTFEFENFKRTWLCDLNIRAWSEEGAGARNWILKRGHT